MQIRHVAAIAAAVIVIAGCTSGRKTTIVTNNGTATIDTSSDAKTTTITTQQGSVQLNSAVDPAKLGLPVYPGATAAEGGGFAMQAKEGGTEMVTLTTTDSFDKVEGWYKSNMPAGSESLNMKTGDSASAMFSVGKGSDKEQRGVMITGAKGKTSILLTHSVKKGP